MKRPIIERAANDLLYAENGQCYVDLFSAHGDFHAVQCVVHDGHISAVVDWESAWSGNSAIDFAVTQVYLESYCPGDLLAAFVTGYLSQRTLPAGYQRDYLPVRMRPPRLRRTAPRVRPRSRRSSPFRSSTMMH